MKQLPIVPSTIRILRPLSRLVVPAAVGLVGLVGITGCPPPGDPPPFVTADPDVAEPDARVKVDVGPDPCEDADNDGFVESEGCPPFRAGDCEPTDSTRHPGAAEICNGLDDDCDNEIDEDVAGAGEVCDTGGLGICSRGLRQCVDARMQCISTEIEGEETCDGSDDDCDGRTDEGAPGAGVECLTDQEGACSEGTLVCRGGGLVCDPLETPSAERCNQRDDDCDGQTDEGNPGGGGSCDTRQAGICSLGEERCDGGAVICVNLQMARDETCNGLDDDCDGNTDEPSPDSRPSCNTGSPGACNAGQLTCVDGVDRCLAAVEPTNESCNGIDDDCDGRADEDWMARIGQTCRVGTGACERAGVLACSGDGDDVACDVPVGAPVDERCNLLDDDCDGRVDESFELGVACAVGDGVCRRQGSTICADDGADVACDAEAGEPGVETCNGLDDDCDAQFDEAFVDLGERCEIQVGGCVSVGAYVCTEARDDVVCDAARIEPGPEMCNDEDDDCDGEIDEDFTGRADGPSKGEPCDVGVGACHAAGLYVCHPDGDDVECDVVAGEPGEEICDGVDNDCDGRVDEQVVCAPPPAGVVDRLAIAGVGEVGCADLSGDGAADNFLAVVSHLFNGPLDDSIGDGSRTIIGRGLGFPPLRGGSFRFELLPGEPIGESFALQPEVLDARGLAATAIERVRQVVGPNYASEAASPILELVSPFFYDRDPDYAIWGALPLHDAGFAGRFNATPDGGLIVIDGYLSGHFDRARAVADFEAAEAACLAAGEARPRGCAVFDRVAAANFGATLQADIDADGDGQAESVSACFRLGLASVSGIPMPPVGGQRCAVDDECPLGLVCRAVPIVDEPAQGAYLAPRCAQPTAGNGVPGSVCEDHDDCLHGLCAERTASGPRCTQLCGDDISCPVGMACRGVAADVPGATTPGGVTARLCVVVTGSGETCDGADCAEGEVCSPWFDGDVGVAGGEVVAQGLCGAANANGVSRGTPCRGPYDCEHGNGCRLDDDGVAICVAPCARTEQCRRGEVCRARNLSLGFDEDTGHSVLQGYCMPTPLGEGDGGPCTADRACPGGQICQPHIVESSGEVDGYCKAVSGFFHVGQRCGADGDCDSGDCVGAPDGVCGGTCRTHGDCGPDLGCVPDLMTVPDTDPPVVFGGRCGAPARECALPVDCEVDPLCAGGRCTCDDGQCRLGCSIAPRGNCADNLVCGADGRCAHFCHDDIAEPNDQLAEATPIGVGRSPSRVDELHQLCVGSPVDWYRVETGGLPFIVRAAPLDPASGLVIELEVFDEEGISIGAGERAVGAVELSFGIADPAEAATWVNRPIFARVRGTGVLEAAIYRLDVELTLPECVDDPGEPADDIWDWQPIANVPGQTAAVVVDASICVQDRDWYAIYLGNGDQLTLGLDVLTEDTGGGGIGVRVTGPGFPSDISATLAEIAPGESGGQIVFTPPLKSCDETEADRSYPRCFHAGYGHTLEACRGETFCAGSTYLIEIYGATHLDQGDYRLDVNVDRALVLDCVPDPFEQNGFLDIPMFNLGWGAIDPELILPGGVPSFPIGRANFPVPAVAPTRDLVFRGNSCGANDLDYFAFFFERDMDVSAQLTQLGELRQAVVRLYNPARGGQLVVENIAPARVLGVDGLRTPSGDLSIWSFEAGIEALPGGAPYELLVRNAPTGHWPDEGCANPEPLALEVDGRAQARRSTQYDYDDHRARGCFGFAGPDHVYRVELPGPGRVTAAVIATNNNTDPAVAIRTVCDAPQTEIACNGDDTAAIIPIRRAAVTADVDGGEIYIFVDAYSAPEGGPYQLDLTFEAADP